MQTKAEARDSLKSFIVDVIVPQGYSISFGDLTDGDMERLIEKAHNVISSEEDNCEQ